MGTSKGLPFEFRLSCLKLLQHDLFRFYYLRGFLSCDDISTEESVRKCLQVIERLDAETSGLLLSHNGDKQRW
jgi:23S rRNA-/tRNA-specific pseudouridylate synthase